MGSDPVKTALFTGSQQFHTLWKRCEKHVRKHVKLNSSHVFSQFNSQVFHSIFTCFYPIVGREALIRQKAFTSETESIRSFMVNSTLKQFGWYQKGLMETAGWRSLLGCILQDLIHKSWVIWSEVVSYIQFTDLPRRSGQNILLELNDHTSK